MTTPVGGALGFALDSIPTVGTTAERNARYPAPPDGFKVFNREVGAFQLASNGTWETEGTGAVIVHATANGTSDDTSAIMAAITAANGGVVYFPDGTYGVTSSIAVPAGTRLVGAGPTRCAIRKNFNGSLFTVTGANYVELSGLFLDGRDSTYTGSGIVVTGSSLRPRITNVVTEGFSVSHIQFGADAGSQAMVSDWYARLGAGSSFRALWINGPDTVGQFRMFVNCVAGLGYHDLDGALDTQFTNCAALRWETDAAVGICSMLGCIWANLGTAMTLNGTTMTVIGCRFAGSVTLAAGSSGTFIGNVLDDVSYTLTNAAATAAWQVLHRPSGTALGVATYLTTAQFGPSAATTVLLGASSGTYPSMAGNNTGELIQQMDLLRLFDKAGANERLRLDLSTGLLSFFTAGGGLAIKTGSNARLGTATLVGGTVVVANTSVTVNTKVFLTRATTGGTPGHLSYTVSAGVSFTITATGGADTSTINWELVEGIP